MQNKQEEIFYAINDLSTSIQYLSGIVQNDFQIMLEEGHVTIDDLKKGREEAAARFKKTILDLYNLRQESLNLIDEAIAEYKDKIT